MENPNKGLAMIEVRFSRLSKIVLALAIPILFFFVLFWILPPVIKYLLPGSYGPSNKSELCKVLQTRVNDCEMKKLGNILEEAFPPETTTRDEVRNTLDEYWLDTFSLTNDDDNSVIDAYAINNKFPFEPDQAFFSFSQDDLLQHITYHSG